MANDKRMSAEELNDYHEKLLSQASSTIARGFKNMETPELYKLFLEHMGDLKGYSLNNTILIHEQLPNASKLESYNDWRDNHELQVTARQKSIRIIKYEPYQVEADIEVIDPKTKTIIRDENGVAITKKDIITIPNFKTEALFDVSQTNAKENQFNELENVDKTVLIESIAMMINQEIIYTDDMNKDEVLQQLIQEVTEQSLENKTELFVKDETGISVSLPKSEQVKLFERESVKFAICQHYHVQMAPEQLLSVSRELDKSDNSHFKGVLESVHTSTMSNIRTIDNCYKEQLQEKEQIKEIPERMSIMDKLAQKKDAIISTSKDKQSSIKSNEMGIQ
ncbi:hypothetical protein IA929_03925 [Listeria seeligeri]|uniref:hypothetical protein n=1 Tax=Listeria seeligeri TaxID=1640 RepID=UPI001888BBB4|nr:hypothetical protein [Listeria seeligeri]MBF2599149.1 hypothetical protein [Listeria seeligeri]